MKLLAPANVASLAVDTETYEPDENGYVVAKTPEHAVALQMHGFIDEVAAAAKFAMVESGNFLENAHRGLSRFVGTSAALATDFYDEEKEALKEALADTRDQLNRASDFMTEMRAEMTALRAAATAPAPVAAASGDTSEKLPPVVVPAVVPLPDAYTRDDAVAWLGKTGVTIPGNVSLATATEAYNTRLAELQKAE